MNKKKIIATLLFSIISLISFSNNVDAYQVVGNLNRNPMPNMFYERTRANYYFSYQFSEYSIDSKVAYCIEPGVDITESTYYATDNLTSGSGYTAETMRKVLLYAYYGYEYPGHNTNLYRVATQTMIWEETDTFKFRYFTERYGYGSYIDISKEKNEIQRLVDNHYVRPSFNGQTITANVGETITLTDNNNVLSNYEVIGNNITDVTINGNQLSFKTETVGEVSIEFQKKQYISNVALVHYNNNTQKMVTSGALDPVYSKLTILSLGGTVEFVKHDKDLNVAQGQATLSGAVYGIYNTNDVLIETLATNDNGYSISRNLPAFGTYYIKEITPSVGYQLDNTKYYFDSNIDSINASLKVYETIISNEFEFTKVYADAKTSIMTPEANVTFGFYNSKGELYKTATTDINGRISINLVFDTYTVKQLTSTTDYEKVDDFIIEVKEMKDTTYKVISNAEVTAKLKVIKIDADTGNIIERANIGFKIFDVINNRYVEQVITYPSKEVISIFRTDSNGILITPYPLASGTYLLEEVDQAMDGYLWNDKSVEFSIGENSELINDNEYGIIFEVKFENKAVKGSIELNKTGEEVELTEEGYIYTEKVLENVKFGLYASEDIFDGMGNLIYSKGSKISELITDVNGYVKVNDLYLGRYYLLELETADNHVLDKNIYYFELKYIDQYTEIINYTLLIKNYLPKGTIEFTKTDFSTSKALPNTLIEIYNENDELIFTGRTDEFGKIIINQLPLGKYYILEIEAPAGYELNPERMYFEILEDGEIIKCNMTNNLIITEVPSTGLNQINYYKITSMLLAVLGLGVLLYANKKKK